jgi:hypothetical protein
LLVDAKYLLFLRLAIQAAKRRCHSITRSGCDNILTGRGGRCDGNAVLTTSDVDLGDFADGCWDSANLNGAIVATAVVAHFLRF